jgi:hypothetical protein
MRAVVDCRFERFECGAKGVVGDTVRFHGDDGVLVVGNRHPRARSADELAGIPSEFPGVVAKHSHKLEIRALDDSSE